MKDSIHTHDGAKMFSLLLALALCLVAPPLARAQTTSRIIFLHHSCGQNLIETGGVRERFTTLGYEFYDHGYNDEGLRLADGSYAGTNFDVPDDNTDPDGFAAIFAQPLHDPPDNTFSHLMQYDVIAFKSCFPVSNIWSDELLAEYQSYYLAIRDRMDQYPDKIFVVVTQPPQVPGNSDPEEASRARAFANWLQSDDYLTGHPNVFAFDFFGLLAGDDNFLRPEYRYDDYDGHPNERANHEIGPLFVTFIDQAIQSYDTAAPRPTAAAPPPTEEGAEAPPPIAPPPETGLVADFESDTGYWETYSDEMGSTIACGIEAGTAHGGTAALHIGYSIVPGGWVDCGHSLDATQDWSGGSGLSLWLHADGAGGWATLTVFSGNPDDPTPFESHFEVTQESTDGWTQFTFPWAGFDRAEWASEQGLAMLDPTRVIGYGFSKGADDTRSDGNLWIDDVGLAEAATQPPAEEEPSGEEPAEEGPAEEPTAGPCPFSTIILPLGALAILLARKRL